MVRRVARRSILAAAIASAAALIACGGPPMDAPANGVAACGEGYLESRGEVVAGTGYGYTYGDDGSATTPYLPPYVDPGTSTDDGSSTDGTTDPPSDDGSYDDGSSGDGSYDDGSSDDGSYDDGSDDDGSDGSADDGWSDELRRIHRHAKKIAASGVAKKKPPVHVATKPASANACYACALDCNVGGAAEISHGVSAKSVDAACVAAYDAAKNQANGGAFSCVKE